jgi:hypothetical protein
MKPLFAIFISGMLILSSCSSTRFPATRAEKRAYKQSQDVQTPRELNLDQESGLGGGK